MCVEHLGINSFVEAVNKNDRLNLLNDPSVLPGNLDNAIHPIFRSAAFASRHLQQALQFSSLLLQEDRLLEFFVPLTYGRAQTDFVSRKTYLTNPIIGKSDREISLYVRGVRQALECLAHSVVFRFISREDRLWGRTLMEYGNSSHLPTCSKAFQRDVSVRIELNGKLRDFYEDEKRGYSTRSRCDQFRHDFQFAATLVHELVHAFGIMRRAGLKEPWISLDLPSNEWGYAWENFAFGTIVNPQDKKHFGTHVQLRKIWASPEDEKNGKEYSAVPVAWTAQWFRKETWERIAAAGLLSIPLPLTRIKFVRSTESRRWIVMTDVPETREDIERLHKCAVRQRLQSPQFPSPDLELCRVRWTLAESVDLQKSNVPLTQRIPSKYTAYSYRVTKKALSITTSDIMYRKTSLPELSCIAMSPTTRLPLAEVTPQSVNACSKRARELDPDDFTPPCKLVKC